ncbi:MAG: translation elongation factor Ts [Candidatus Cryptobacteroides sp.]|nr:translation elongation factor Ts [Bacteroidales bacterium]MDY6158514.1 translation elongation factor Ts [Candidatus Cryptobacteroides sp.]
MAITAADVMKLRKMTSAGMMDCKKALEEAQGDFNKAMDIIREKGKLVAAKRADRETSEGAVKARVEGNKGILVCLGCETDFVSRNSDFQNLAEAIADVAIAQCPADLEGLKACKMADGYTVEEAVEAQTGKTGEKHVLVGYALVEAPFVAQYIHKITGKLGALVGFNKEVPAELAKGIVMQVASMNPVAISAEDCPQEVIDSERNVAIQKTKDEQIQKAVDAALKKAGINPAHVDSEDHIESNTAKGWLTPEQANQAREIIKTVSAEKAANLNEQMIQNIANGRVQKFLKEQTLLEQDYQMSDEKISVKDALAAADKEAKVVVIKRFSLND